ncbi:PREDICTED: DNA-directed DNA/RNA polymerase mu [Nanorana parkeri]|uniref:DNA-directed DNA/RNA polymerase mu n=1 Tax=Nanorana parkeri TaxID=125878 RepID=UPI000854CB87|nr:PREDICTED: DNA-directed DNA/RNA polymerase mu [Nanorana parkeri]
MGAARRGFLAALAQRKGFSVAQEYSDAVTHVVSEQNSLAEVLGWIEGKTGCGVQRTGRQKSPHFLDISWFTESMSAGEPMSVEGRHCLQGDRTSSSTDKADHSAVLPYACQRRTPLMHHNSQITDALEILARAASFRGSEVRYLGFTRAASMLKSLPYKLQSVEEAEDLPWCGGHCKSVIQEILEDGVCREAEALKASEHYQCMELLTSIFGVGVKTAERWYKDGVRKLDDLKDPKFKLTTEQRLGLEHYTDLRLPVTHEEADRVQCMIREALQTFVPDIQITMTGGFRRGKQQGHDVDFLITHPDNSALTGLLKKAMDWLDGKGLLLYRHRKERSHAPHRLNRNMDGHETCYSIFALPIGDLKSERDSVSSGVARSIGDSSGVSSPIWKAVRVDLVVTPYSEYPYALLGWTGSKHFERELRRFSLQEKKMTLSSHGLFDGDTKCSIAATSEEEIFAYLGLDYVPPSDRNA